MFLARSTGDTPWWFFCDGFAPASRSIRMTSPPPREAKTAVNRGVFPSRFRVSTSASASNSSFVISRTQPERRGARASSRCRLERMHPPLRRIDVVQRQYLSQLRRNAERNGLGHQRLVVTSAWGSYRPFLVRPTTLSSAKGSTGAAPAGGWKGGCGLPQVP